MNKIQIAKVVGVVSAFVAPMFAFADGFGTSTIGATIAGLILDFGLIVAAVLAGILGLWVAFVGLGWAIAKLKKYGTGKHKF